MIHWMIRVAVLAVAVLLLARPTPADAQIYRWVDERGVPHYADGIDSVPENYRATAVPTGFRNAPASSTPPAVTGASVGGSSATEIRFTRGEAIVVNATINGRTAVKLILDTGADRTVINPRALAAAGASLTEGPPGQIRGATGTASAQAAAIDTLEVGGAKVSKLFVIAHDIEQGAVDGLLGRDFLDQFKVSIDSDNGVATLAPKTR
jgi:hypothetical protein